MAVEELPVLAGLDAVLKINGEIVAWATNVSFNEDFELQGIRTLGYHGDRGYKSQGYNASATVGTLLLLGDQADHVPMETRRTILRSGLVDMHILAPVGPEGDTSEADLLYILSQCKVGTQDVTFDSGTLVARNTTWRCREVIPQRADAGAGVGITAVS